MSNTTAEQAAIYAQRIMELERELKRRDESDAKRFEDSQKLQAIGKSAFDSIAEMVAALECDYDRLEELTAQHGDTGLDETEHAEWYDLKSAAGDCESRDEATQRIHDDPLSVELSGTWTNGETPTADKAIILLTTGGPAVRIVCELDEHMEPHRAWLEVQDWFLPWTQVYGDSDTLLTYCRCFYFGEA